jgi:plasmid stabilization system protein ParE
MAKLIVHSGADDDFVESYLWYAKQDRRAAVRFESQLKDAFDRVAADPQGGTAHDSLYRFYRLKNYPHLVIYRYSTADDTATIVAVAHPSRDQSYWQNR